MEHTCFNLERNICERPHRCKLQTSNFKTISKYENLQRSKYHGLNKRMKSSVSDNIPLISTRNTAGKTRFVAQTFLSVAVIKDKLQVKTRKLKHDFPTCRISANIQTAIHEFLRIRCTEVKQRKPKTKNKDSHENHPCSGKSMIAHKSHMTQCPATSSSPHFVLITCVWNHGISSFPPP